MSARKRHNKWWVDFRFNRRRYRKPSPDNTRAGAQAYETLLRYKLARGEPLDVEEKRTNFKEFVENWFQTYVKNNNKHSEVISKESILRVHLIPYFGGLQLEKIGSLDIEKYKAEKLKEGLCAKTINNHLSVLRTSFRSAVEWGIISACPITKMLKTPPQKYDLLSMEECWLLIRTAEGSWRDMIITALGTGLRFGELIALSWRDIDFEKRELIVRQAFARGVLGSPKSNKTRLIPINTAVYKVLHNVTRKSLFVFVDSHGKPMKQIASLKKLHRICRRAGLREIGWHCLRHTFASHLIQAGANIVAVQNLLGHADIRTTMRYTHINIATLREAVGILDGDGVSKNFGHNMVTTATFAEDPYVIAKDDIPPFGSTKGKESLRSLLPA